MDGQKKLSIFKKLKMILAFCFSFADTMSLTKVSPAFYSSSFNDGYPLLFKLDT